MGCFVGIRVGCSVTKRVGWLVGGTTGSLVGFRLGCNVVGWFVGDRVVGEFVGGQSTKFVFSSIHARFVSHKSRFVQSIEGIALAI